MAVHSTIGARATTIGLTFRSVAPTTAFAGSTAAGCAIAMQTIGDLMAQAEIADYGWHTHDRHGVPVHTHAHPHGAGDHTHAGWTLVSSLDDSPHLEFEGIRASDEVTPLSVLHAATGAAMSTDGESQSGSREDRR